MRKNDFVIYFSENIAKHWQKKVDSKYIKYLISLFYNVLIKSYKDNKSMLLY